VSIFVNDENPLKKLVAMGATALAGGSVTSISTVQSIVNALNANTDFAALAVASCDNASLANRAAQATTLGTLSGGLAGQWTIDANFTRGISVNADGNLAYKPFDSGTAVTVAVKAGAIYPIAAQAVMSTDTTTTGIVGHI
jgi:hypothetical protein